jgi:hypothetical protein
VEIQGRGPQQIAIEIVDSTGRIRGEATTNAGGEWVARVALDTAGEVTIRARRAAAPSERSEPVTITVAPVVQPETGIAPAPENEQGATVTALLAILLTALGIALIFAGRLLYNLAHHPSD